MLKIIILLVVIGAVYTGLNWETLSPKIEHGLKDASEMMEKGNEMHQQIKQEMEDTQEKIDDVKESLEDIIEKK